MASPPPTVRATVRTLSKEHPFTDAVQLNATALKLWSAAQDREERYAATMEPLLLVWSPHTNMWFRRTSIIAQLPAKTATNTTLLEALLVPDLAGPDFFIRKACGWALRQYARTDPCWVLDFVARHKNEISSLTYREALKHLN